MGKPRSLQGRIRRVAGLLSLIYEHLTEAYGSRRFR
jgi:hypothetical protein